MPFRWSMCPPNYPVFLSGISLRFPTKGLHTIASNDGIHYVNLRETIITRQFATCNQLASRILVDIMHPLHSHLEAARTRRSTRQMFPLLLERTEAYKKLIIPILVHLLCDQNAATAELRTNLSIWICLFYHFFILNPMFAENVGLGLEAAKYIRSISFQLMAIIWRRNMYELTCLFICFNRRFLFRVSVNSRPSVG